jgi:putative transposase
MQLVSLGSSLGESNFHLQFTPKYRRDVFLDDEVRAFCRECFRDVCAELRIGMEACEFGPDHVHVFVSGCKNYSVPEIAMRLKGASSRRIRLELWERVKDKLWGDAFWSSGYFYRSVGSTTAEAVQFYVEHSQRKHCRGFDYEAGQREERETRGQAKLDEF